MKHKKLITTAALALAAISFVSTYASAATITAGTDDLILGFQVTDGAGTGANTNLEVDLGQASSFTTGATFNLTQLAGADLTAVYGSNWATRTDLSWGIAGELSSSSFDATSNGNSIAFDTGSQGATVLRINPMAGLLNGQTSTTNSAFAAAIGDNTNPASGIGGSYTAQILSAGATAADFGIAHFNQGDTQRGFSGETVLGSTGTGTLELYKFINGTNTTHATDLGTFSLTSAGVLSYQGVAAVPEPSTWALALCGLLLVLVIRRRNFQV